jgi:hypothetical protein
VRAPIYADFSPRTFINPKNAASADLLGVLEHSKFALNVAFFVRHEYFLHPKSGTLQEVSRESAHIYRSGAITRIVGFPLLFN